MNGHKPPQTDTRSVNPSRADLLTSLGIGERDNIPDLEALLEVQIGGGVPAPPVSH